MLDNKIALVTGGSRGIGAQICKKLGEHGAFVIINYNGNQEKALEIKKEIIDNGGKAEAIKCNVSSFEDCKAYIEYITKEYGKIDILVNNAGITRDGLIMGMSEKDYDDVLNTNLKGTFNCIRFAIKTMIKNKYGRIINISSTSGVLGNAGQANYSASKAGIIGLTKSVAREVAKKNITVNAVAPGFINTDMTMAMKEKSKEIIISKIPVGRMGNTQDIANAVIFFASDNSSYITGQILNVDGGLAI